MRVARIVNKLPPASGGKEIHAAELSRALADLGYEQHVFARIGDEIDPRVRLTRLPGHFSSDGRRTLVAFGMWVVPRVLRAHAKEPFGLIHAHGDFVEAAAAAAISKACGIPAVLTVHADFGAVRWQNAVRRGAFGRMATIWTVSQSTGESVRGSGVDVPVVVRSSAVRKEFFDGHAQPREGGIVFVGRINPLKGLEHLIAAHDLVGEQLGVPWTIFGTGSGRYAEQIIAAVDTRPLMDVRNERDPTVLAKELTSARVFVLPSVDLGTLREGVPTALLEAIATRTPIIAADTAGIAALLDGGRAGTLVEPESPRALADAIVATVEDPEGAASRAEHAFALGHARPWPELAREVAERYEQVAGRARAAGRSA